MSKLTKKQIAKIEDIGWNVDVGEDGYYTLQSWSPADGEMNIYAKSVEEIIDQCENYDVDEEFNIYWEAKHNGFRGVPSTPTALYNDCVAKGEMYEELARVLKQ